MGVRRFGDFQFQVGQVPAVHFSDAQLFLVSSEKISTRSSMSCITCSIPGVWLAA